VDHFPSGAPNLLIRADLLIQLQKTIASRGLTQVKAAKILRVTQPRVSDLLRGRIDLFSTDSLIDMLARLGVEVRLVLKPARSSLGLHSDMFRSSRAAIVETSRPCDSRGFEGGRPCPQERPERCLDVGR
jgi:predicted XRE-type DNA-binding protein